MPDTLHDNSAIPSTPRKPLIRSVLLLGLGVILVFSFILWQGDLRRRRFAMVQIREHGDYLVSKVGPAQLLPLNLAAKDNSNMTHHHFKIDTPTRSQARQLRERPGPILAAYTYPVRQSLRSYGRAVVFFEDGRFQPDWLTLEEFEKVKAKQQAKIKP